MRVGSFLAGQATKAKNYVKKKTRETVQGVKSGVDDALHPKKTLKEGWRNMGTRQGGWDPTDEKAMNRNKNKPHKLLNMRGAPIAGRGWRGEGDLRPSWLGGRGMVPGSKYLPVGPKALLAYGALGGAGDVAAGRDPHTGEMNRRGSAVGSLVGSTLGEIAGYAGKGSLARSMAFSLGAGYLGRAVGSTFDKKLPKNISAPKTLDSGA